MRTCSKCGASNADDSKFCETCGTLLAETAAPEAAAPAAAPASDYQQQSQAPKSDYYEDPKTHTGKAISGNAYGIQQRNIAVCIILSLVTCGIYLLYWYYKMSEEFRQLTGDDSLPDGVMTILLGLVTCNIYLLYWHYKMGQACDKLKGDPNGNSAVLYLLLMLFGIGIASMALEQNAINQAVA